MKTWLKGIFVASGMLCTMPSQADLELNLGVYAANKTVRMTWECASVVEAVSTIMERELDERVTVNVLFSQAYDTGVNDVTTGAVDFARFPNVDRYWVISPDVSAPVKAAWRKAIVDLQLDLASARIPDDAYQVNDLLFCSELDRITRAQLARL